MKYHYIKSLLALLIGVTVFTVACQKDNDSEQVSGIATVTVDLKGIGANSDSGKLSPRSSTASGRTTTPSKRQEQVIPFNEQLQIKATLHEIGTTETSALRASANRSASTVPGELESLAPGTAYTVRVLDGGTEVAKHEFTEGAPTDFTFSLEAGKAYTFQAFAYGNAQGTGAEQDPLWWEDTVTLTEGRNTLSIVLAHKLTEVTVVFDAGAERTIQSITNGTVGPNHDYDFDESTGNVTFKAEIAAAPLNFADNAAGRVWTSQPTMLAVESTTSGVVTLGDLTINNITGSISSDGWALRAGVQYKLVLELGDKGNTGFEIGGFLWAPGNLIYNNGEYGFAGPTEQGDFWYFNWLLPVGEGTAPQITDMPEYHVDRDPCTLVPGGGWYTPSSIEYEALIATPGVATDWQYQYDGGTSNHGVFYGTDDLQLASANSADYLFFPGTLDQENKPQNNKYWTYNSETVSNAASIQFGGYNKPNTIEGLSENKTSIDIKIRCIKNVN